MPRNRREVPLEIIHMIVERLHSPEDITALRACALVCRRWQALARKHIFAFLTIYSQQHRVLEPTRGPQQWELFHSHFFKPSYFHLSSVKSLRLAGPPTKVVRLRFHQLLPVLGSLPRLQHLHVDSWDIVAFSEESNNPSFDHPLESLALRNLGFASQSESGLETFVRPKDLLDVLGCFPRVKSVDFDNICAHRPIDNLQNHGLPTLFSPHTVRISPPVGDFNHLLFDIFHLTPGIAQALRSICIVFSEFAPIVPAVARLLDAASGLETLEFDFATNPKRHLRDLDFDGLMEWYCDEVQDELAPVLSEMHALRTFVLCAPAEQDDDEGLSWNPCFDIIKALPFTLRHLELRVRARDKEFLLRRIQEATEHLTSLQAMKFVLCERQRGAQGEEQVAGWGDGIREGLPELSRRGILEVALSMSP